MLSSSSCQSKSFSNIKSDLHSCACSLCPAGFPRQGLGTQGHHHGSGPGTAAGLLLASLPWAARTQTYQYMTC